MMSDLEIRETIGWHQKCVQNALPPEPWRNEILQTWQIGI
jgi:hypothetical protein